MFNITPIPAFNDNYIWALASPGSNEVAVIDPGDADKVNQYLKKNGLQLSAILITHHHDDHTGGVNQLKSEHNATVYGPHNSPFEGLEVTLKQGDQVELFGQSLQVHEVPGHTLDHISYYLDGTQPQLFCGDTLFLAGCGRLFEGSAEQMHKAMEYFRSLPDITKIYCTHEYSLANLAFAAAVEPSSSAIQAATIQCNQLRQAGKPTLPTDIATEKQINPFLRYGETTVKQSAEQFSNTSLATEVAVFGAIREWKNSF